MSLNYSQLIAYIDGLYQDGQLSEQDYNAIIVYILANGDVENAPRDLIQVRRGEEINVPILAQGEFGYALDTENLFIGGLNGNNGFYGKKFIDELTKGVFNVAQFSGANDTEIIENAIKRTPDGGILIFEPRFYDSGVNVNRSNITIILPAGCEFNYTFHFAIGSTTVDVENIKIYGEIRTTAPDGNTTSGVGCYHCDNVYVEAVRTNNFKFGAHIYTGSKNVHIGKIIVDSSTKHGCPIDTSNPLYPLSNITIDYLEVKNTNVLGIGTYSGVPIQDVDGVHIGRIVQDNSNLYGVYIYDCENVFIDEIDAKNNGVRNVQLQKLTKLNNVKIGKIISDNAGRDGIDVTGGATNIEIQSIESNNNGGDGLALRQCDNIKINNITAKNNASYGFEIGNVQQGQYSNIRTDENVLGGVVMGLVASNVDNILVNVVSNNNTGRGIAQSGGNTSNLTIIGARGTGNGVTNNVVVGTLVAFDMD